MRAEIWTILWFYYEIVSCLIIGKESAGKINVYSISGNDNRTKDMIKKGKKRKKIKERKMEKEKQALQYIDEAEQSIAAVGFGGE